MSKKKSVMQPIITIIAVTFSAFLMALDTKTFVNTGGLYPGGVTGLTILIQRSVEMLIHVTLPFSLVNILLNAVPVYIGFRYIGKRFTLYSCLMIVLNSLFTDLIPPYIITEDVLLISIFGGIIHGLTISICLNANATSGGTDFISIFLSERRGIDSFNIILGFNAVILCIAGLIFGWDKALYSIIFQYASTAVLHVLYKKYQQSTLFIVTTKPAKVCEAIYKVSMHGATILEGEGSYEQCERNVVYSVVSAAQTKKVIRAVRDADPDVFINEVKTQKLSGRFYQPKEQ
ncbi:MAG: YitT family protein [Oscillospiraceae bacterium]|nr:YitT family protein [Ruminococcus sp.]MDD6097877.1 YitT family protein [Oscillospiraceae bacterium]